jgi:hypothetical protein
MLKSDFNLERRRIIMAKYVKRDPNNPYNVLIMENGNATGNIGLPDKIINCSMGGDGHAIIEMENGRCWDYDLETGNYSG